MQDISDSLTVVVFLALGALLVAAVGVPVEIEGTLQDVTSVPPSGKILVVQEMLHLSPITHEVREDRRFRFTCDSEGPLVIHAVSRGRSSTERASDAGTTRAVVVNLTLPVGRSVPVRVVDAEGNAVR